MNRRRIPLEKMLNQPTDGLDQFDETVKEWSETKPNPFKEMLESLSKEESDNAAKAIYDWLNEKD